MQIDRKRLTECLDTLSVSAGSKHFTVCNFLRLVYKDGWLYLATSNYESYTILSLEPEYVKYDGPEVALLIEFKTLHAIVSRGQHDVVILDFDNKNHVVVRDSGSYNIPCNHDVSEFMMCDLSFHVEHNLTDVESEDLKSMWATAVTALDTKHIKYRGIWFNGEMSATDGKRLVVSSRFDGRIKGCVVPKAFGMLLKKLKGSVTIGLTENEKFLLVVCGDLGMVAATRLLDVEYPDYTKVVDIDESVTDQYRIYVEHVLSTVERLDCLGSDPNLILFEEKDNLLRLSNDMGSELIVTALAMDVKNRYTYTYDSKNLMKLLKRTKEKEVRMQITPEGKLYVESQGDKTVLMGQVA